MYGGIYMHDRETLRYIKNNNCLPFPSIVQLEITNVCPFHCPQCYKLNIQDKHMHFEKLKSIISFCYSHGTRFFVLNGGEPLLYYKIKDLINFLNKLDVDINCFSSGYGLNSEILDMWNFEKFNMCLSLNGSTKLINDYSRDGYEYTINGMKLLYDKQKKFGVNWVARHDNVHDFPELISLVNSYNVDYVFVTSNKLTGEREIISPLTLDDFIFLSDFINNNNTKTKILVESCFSTLATLIKPELKKYAYFKGCFAGINGCHVDIDFNFSPCTHLHYKESYDDIKNYWEESKILKALRQARTDEMSPCNECIHKYDCRFCKASSMETYSDFSKGLKNCLVFKKEVQHE